MNNSPVPASVATAAVDHHPTPRSWLYVPGDQDDKLRRAASRGADAIIVDLEDGVAPSAKVDARRVAGAFLAARAAARDPASFWVRCNPGAERALDLDAVVGPALAGVVVPKAERREDLERLDAEIAELEAARGLKAAAVQVMPLAESASAVLALQDLAAAPRVRYLSLGEADLCADLGTARRPLLNGGPLELARSLVVVAAAAAGLDAAVGSASTDFRDLGALRADCEWMRASGYWGAKAIHPSQVAVINDVFSVSEDDEAAAARLVARYDAALAAGQGVTTDERGRMVDEAVVRSARRTLQRARSSLRR